MMRSRWGDIPCSDCKEKGEPLIVIAPGILRCARCEYDRVMREQKGQLIIEEVK